MDANEIGRILVGIAPIVSILGGIAAAGLTYWFAKQREREAEIRKEKLEHYKDFASALCGIEKSICTDEAQRAFARSCTKLQLIAPQSVIEALHDFQIANRVGNVLTKARHDSLLTRLFIEIRRDLHVDPPDDNNTFNVMVWGSGKPPDSEKEEKKAAR